MISVAGSGCVSFAGGAGRSRSTGVVREGGVAGFGRLGRGRLLLMAIVAGGRLVERGWLARVSLEPLVELLELALKLAEAFTEQPPKRSAAVRMRTIEWFMILWGVDERMVPRIHPEGRQS